MRVTFQGFQCLPFPGLKGDALRRAAQAWEQQSPETRCVEIFKDGQGQDYVFNFDNAGLPHREFVLNMRKKEQTLGQRVRKDARSYQAHSPFVERHTTISAKEYYRRHPEVGAEQEMIDHQWQQFTDAVFSGETTPLPDMDNPVDRLRKAYQVAGK